MIGLPEKYNIHKAQRASLFVVKRGYPEGERESCKGPETDGGSLKRRLCVGKY